MNDIVKKRLELENILGRKIRTVFHIGTIQETGEVLYGINGNNGKLRHVAVYSPDGNTFRGIL